MEKTAVRRADSMQERKRAGDRLPAHLASPKARQAFIAFAAFIFMAIVFGGSSRADALSQPVIRMLSILMIAACILWMSRQGFRVIRLPLLFVLSGAAVALLQLLPLPQNLWASLSGRAIHADALTSAGIGAGWRPLSLVPDMTINALLAFLPPAAAILAMGAIDRRRDTTLVPLLLVGIAISAVVSVVQIASGQLYFYKITSLSSGVGFFANRNHQALVLACALPLIGCWCVFPQNNRLGRGSRAWMGLCLAALVFPLILVSGSRAGLALGFVGAVWGLIIYWRGSSASRPVGWKGAALLGIPVAIGIGAAALAFFYSKGVSLTRLIATDEGELRFALIPYFQRMMADYFPFGSGLGSFNAVYRIYEPHAFLDSTYLNHVHNDFIEIIIETGLIGAVMVIAFLAWLAVSTVSALRSRTGGPSQMLALAGSAIITLCLAHSLVDYPVRTPFVSILLAIAAVWLHIYSRPPVRVGEERDLAEVNETANRHSLEDIAWANQ